MHSFCSLVRLQSHSLQVSSDEFSAGYGSYQRHLHKDFIDAQYTPPPQYVISSRPRPDWLASSGPGQLNIAPSHWSLTMRQFKYWLKDVRATAHYKSFEGQVSMYAINDEFIVPWSANTGNSIALLMNARSSGLAADVMISHGVMPQPKHC